ncbi:MAG: response regulator [Sphingobacteriales bacterium]|nr:MAG: response regulator [Sphingobacteriales bacterium]
MNEILIVEDEFIVANDLRIILEKAGYSISGIAASVKEALEMLEKRVPDLVVLDIYLQGDLTGIDLAMQLREKNIAFVYLSANSNQSVLEKAKLTQPYGFLVKPFRPRDVLITVDIARYRHENGVESKYRREEILRNKLISIAGEPGNLENTMTQICSVLQTCIPFDYFAVSVNEGDEAGYRAPGLLRIGFDEYQIIGLNELATISRVSKQELSLLQTNFPADNVPTIYDDEKLKSIIQTKTFKRLIVEVFGMKSHLALPLKLSSGVIFHIFLYSRKSNIYNSEHLAVFNRIESLLIKTIEASLEHKFNTISTSPVNISVAKPFERPSEFRDIIGNSHKLLSVLDEVVQVAHYDTSVLILGESGTGKEKIAHSIHHLSPRKKNPFIKINCASIPATLIESELFGHEKGAFTGAHEKRIGKFEQANSGTIFLDEIGEMPLDLQVKLLRVLQEKEIERLGGKETIKIDVRIIAATNKNLEEGISKGTFRLDLYYRLSVFPIVLPSLKERIEDIRLLADYFADRFTKIAVKPYYGISPQMLDELEAYDWPGNIRELENVIEQSVILNDGKTMLQLKRSLSKGRILNLTTNDLPGTINTFSDVKKFQEQTEKEYILSVLKITKGRVRGSKGAAEILNLKPTTLEAKMAKLGITKDDIFELPSD